MHCTQGYESTTLAPNAGRARTNHADRQHLTLTNRHAEAVLLPGLAARPPRMGCGSPHRAHTGLAAPSRRPSGHSRTRRAAGRTRRTHDLAKSSGARPSDGRGRSSVPHHPGCGRTRDGWMHRARARGAAGEHGSWPSGLRRTCLSITSGKGPTSCRIRARIDGGARHIATHAISLPPGRHNDACCRRPGVR